MYEQKEALTKSAGNTLPAQQEFFPDGTPIDEWFYDIEVPTLDMLGKQYVLTEYNILDDGKLHTKEIPLLQGPRAFLRSRPFPKSVPARRFPLRSQR